MAEIYDNIENYKEITYEQLVVENRDLKVELDETTAELKQIKMDILQAFDKLAHDHQQLLINYSSLLKTARAEVERKADMMMTMNSMKDQRFLRLLYDRTNMGKEKRGRKKSGSVDISDQRIKTQTLNDDKDQLLERKDPILQQKSKTEYRIPKLTKPKDEIDVPKKEKSELKKERKFNDGLNEKENKQRTVKAGSIFNRRKSMPVFRHEPVIFSSDEETESTVTLSAKSCSTRDETDPSLNRYKQDKPTEQSRMKPNEPPSSDMRYSDHRQPTKMETRQSYHREQPKMEYRHSDQREQPSMEYRQSDHREPPSMEYRNSDRSREQPSMEKRHLDREPPKDLRHKLAKNYEPREIHRSKERYPSREDPRKHREQYNQKDRHRQFETNVQHMDPRLSRKDMHDHRQNERGRLRILESPPPDKYSRNKSRDRRSNYQQSGRQIEQESQKHRAYKDAQVKQKIRDEAPAEHLPDSQRMDRPPEPKCDMYKAQPPVKSKIRDEDGEPEIKRRKVESRTFDEDHGKHESEQRPMELVAMSPHTCQSPDELLVENVHVETPVKEIMNTVATGLEDPRLTSTRYKQIVEEKNRIRLSTVTGRNVDLEVLPPYSTDVFQSKDPNSKFEEYTEEDLVKDIYIDFDDADVNDTLESGEIDDNSVCSDLMKNPPPTKVALEKQKTTNINPSLLLSATLDTPQISQYELLQPASAKNRQKEDAEVLQESIRTSKEIESNKKPIEDEPSYSGVMAKKFRIPKRKSTENALEENQTITMETVSGNLNSTPKNPLEFILSHITQKCGVKAANACPTDVTGSSVLRETLEHVAEKTTQFSPTSSTQEELSDQKHKNKHPADDSKAIKNSFISENPLAVIKSEPKKVLTKRQIVAGDLELSDDDNSANIDLNHTAVKEKKETSKEQTKPVETKKQKTRGRTRKEQTEDKKTAKKDQGKDKPKSNKFTELFGDSSSLITPEDLELYTRPHAEFPSEIAPQEDEAAVQIDMIDKATLAESCERRHDSAKIRTRSSNKTKKEDSTSKKISKRAKATEATTEKSKADKKTAKQDDKMEGVPSEMVVDTVEVVRVNPAVEAEPSVVKTVIISTGTQPVVQEIPKSDNAPIAVVAPMVPTSFKPFSQVLSEPIMALATSTPCRDLRSEACKMTPPISINNTNETTRVSDEDSSVQSVTVDSLSQSKEADAPDVRVILKRRRKRVIK